MRFVAIMKATPDGRIAKYQDFPTEVEANAHVSMFAGMHPDAFTIAEPSVPFSHWRIDMAARTVVADPPPPPDFNAIDQATVDRLLLESSVMRALAKMQFQIINDVRALQSQSPITAAQYKTQIKGLIR